MATVTGISFHGSKKILRNINFLRANPPTQKKKSQYCLLATQCILNAFNAFLLSSAKRAGCLVSVITGSRLYCDLRSFPSAPRFLSSAPSPQFGSQIGEISETFLQCSHCKSLWPFASGRDTASLKRSSHSTPNMKTYVAIKALLVPRGTHSCETLPQLAGE